MFSKLSELGVHVECEIDCDDIYTVGACDDIYTVAAKKDNQSAVMITYFTNDTEAKSKKIEVILNNCPVKAYNIFLLDNDHDANKVGKLEITNDKVCFNIEPNTVVLLKSAE